MTEADKAYDDAFVLGARAIGVLESLLEMGCIPSWSLERVQKLIADYDVATAKAAA